MTCGCGAAEPDNEGAGHGQLPVKWVRAHDGRRMVSAVSYDKPSAEHRQAALEAEGATNIEIVKVKPGQ